MNLTAGDIVLGPWVIIVIIILAIIFLAVTIIWGVKAHRMKIGAGKEQMIGRPAKVVTALNPKGTVFLEGEQWTAISEGGRVEPGEEVTVTRIEGLKVYVKKNQ